MPIFLEEPTKMVCFFYLYMILLQEAFSVWAEEIEETCKQDTNNCENIVEGVKIHWDLNGLSQDDPVLIENIKNKVLWVISDEMLAIDAHNNVFILILFFKEFLP